MWSKSLTWPSIGMFYYSRKELFPASIPYAEDMPAQRQKPRESLSINLRHLMATREWNQVQLAKRSGVNQKTISNILNGRNTPTLDILDQIAAAFGLNVWHLILPDLPADLVNGGTIERLFENFIASGEKGREYINHVAEREAKYKTGGE